VYVPAPGVSYATREPPATVLPLGSKTSANTLMLFCAVEPSVISMRDGPETVTARCPSQPPFATLPLYGVPAADAEPAKAIHPIASPTGSDQRRNLPFMVPPHVLRFTSIKRGAPGDGYAVRFSASCSPRRHARIRRRRRAREIADELGW